ncbi:MAG: tryptophan--tRNA ligase [Arsenophonus sp.]|nr:MAG: tryptophan--tRNA ligase [Arsenophonus sp.]
MKKDKKIEFNKRKKILFSGTQPSGLLTIGNYIGAIKQWVLMQNKNNYNCIFCIVDHHTVTKKQDPDNMKKNIIDTLALYLACGINPKKSIVFIQSHVQEHVELNWILSCYTYFGELKRMTQFKKNLNNRKISQNVGLFNYPILMASDILLYQSNVVPVGLDQKQHIELTINIAKRFNKIYGDIFVIPQPCFSKKGKKILSLQQLDKKMSKSDRNKNNIITLLEDPKQVVKKITRATTDSENPPKVFFDLKNKIGISNLMNIFSGITGNSYELIEKEFKGKLYQEFKLSLSEVVSSFLKDIQNKFLEFKSNKKFLMDIVLDGADQAKKIAKHNIRKIKESIGYI